jgi:hypothetical protein
MTPPPKSTPVETKTRASRYGESIDDILNSKTGSFIVVERMGGGTYEPRSSSVRLVLHAAADG